MIRTLLARLALLALVFVALVAPSFASAQYAESARASDVEGLRVGGLVGGGFMLNAENEDVPNPQGLGLGLQLSYTLPMGLALGMDVLWFLGSTDDSTDLVDTRFNTLQITFDVGYDIAVGSQFVLRPMLGFGVNRYHIKSEGTFLGADFSDSESDAGFLLVPGVEAFFDITDMAYVGALLRFPMAFMGDEKIRVNEDGTDVSLQIAVTGGVRF